MKNSVLSSLALGAALAGLSVLPASAQVYVRIAPPAPIVETVPAAHPAGTVWVGGYWRWNRSRYVWVPGHYAHPGAGYRHWCAGHWHNGPRGYWWVDGHWC